MNMDAIKAIGSGSAVAEQVKAFRSAAVTSENKATPLARSVLAALVAETATRSLIESLVITAFGNPKTPKGKPITALTGSGDYLPGWGATRKTVGSIFAIFEDIDTDKPVPVMGEDGETPTGDTIGAGECRRLIVSFILNEKDAPKSLRALREAVKAAVASHAALVSPPDAEAEQDAADALADEQGTAAPDAPVSLLDRVNALIVAYGAADAEAKAEAHGALQSLFAAVNADVAAEAKEMEPAE